MMGHSCINGALFDQFQTLLTPVDGVQKEPHIYLVGGRPTPLKNIWVNWDDGIPNIWKHKKCSKPPTTYHFNTCWFSNNRSTWERFYCSFPSVEMACIVHQLLRNGHGPHVGPHGCLIRWLHDVKLGRVLSPGVSILDLGSWFLHSSLSSIDWFKGKITGKSHISWENLWFPVDFPLSQPIDISVLGVLIERQISWISLSNRGVEKRSHV